MDEQINNELFLAAGFESRKQQGFEVRSLAEMERAYIEMVISLCHGNIPRASEILKVSPSTIYRKKAKWTGECPGFTESGFF